MVRVKSLGSGPGLKLEAAMKLLVLWVVVWGYAALVPILNTKSIMNTRNRYNCS